MKCNKCEYYMETKPLFGRIDLYCAYKSMAIHQSYPCELIGRKKYGSPYNPPIPKWCPLKKDKK